MEQTRLLEKIIVSLKQEKFRKDSFDDSDHTYTIETQIEISEREWCFSSVVTYNGVEITDDPELIKETNCRKRVAQINKTKALWNLFVKEAAAIHFERCKAVIHRLENSGKRPLTVNSRAVMALVIVVLSCFVLSMFYLTRSPTQPMGLHSDIDDKPPPVTPVALPLEEPEPAPPVDVSGRGPNDSETISPAAAMTRTPDVSDYADSPAMSVESTDESPPTPRSTAMDQVPDPSQTQPEDSQMVKALSPEDIKAQVRSILENKTESP